MQQQQQPHRPRAAVGLTIVNEDTVILKERQEGAIRKHMIKGKAVKHKGPSQQRCLLENILDLSETIIGDVEKTDTEQVLFSAS